MDEIVERINRADWVNGHATEARKWLLDLLSNERDVCMRAYHRLDDFLVNRNAPPEAKLVLETIANPIDEWGQYNWEDE